jgi:cation-transporting ATPase 13A1
MMASSWLIMTAAISFSYASPLDHMHPLRPLRSLFHPAIIVSTLGQALIHIACMTLAVQWATDAMGPEALKEVSVCVQCDRRESPPHRLGTHLIPAVVRFH